MRAGRQRLTTIDGIRHVGAMPTSPVHPSLLHAWLAGRSVARGLPQPVADHGGFRVDSGTETEVARWVFAQVEPGLLTLGRTITEARHFLKLCGDGETLRKVLPACWQLQAPGFFMQAGVAWDDNRLTDGYSMRSARDRAAVSVHVFAPDGTLAASGHGGETETAFVYDRIVTAPNHQRKGLGRAVMSALRTLRHNPHLPELLVATEDGHALYTRLGWRTLSHYSTASIPSF